MRRCVAILSIGAVAAPLAAEPIFVDQSLVGQEPVSTNETELRLQLEAQREQIRQLNLRLEALENNPIPAAPQKPSRKAPAAKNEGGNQEPKNKPGQFVVDEEAAERALEKTLVQTGVLLLPAGRMEFETGLDYVHNQTSTPIFIPDNGTTLLGKQDFRRNTVEASVFFRLGLPGDSQIELGVPYRYVDQSGVSKVLFNEVAEDSSSGSGVGDVTLGIAKTLRREKGWKPDVIARFVWDTDTGEEEDQGLALGGQGVNEYGVSLAATKRQDPMVFSIGVSYFTAEEKDDFQAGDSLGISLTAFLAASPSTSFQFGVDQTIVGEDKVNGTEIDGSDQVIGALTLGTSSIVGRGKFLNVTTGIGLTDDAADYSLSFSYSVSFGI